MDTETDDGTILTLLQPVLGQVEPTQMPALVAVLERLAAPHYQRWADSSDDPETRRSLLAGKQNEEDNAAVIERLFTGAAEQGKALLNRFPELETLFDRAFADLAPTRQLKAQAAAERVGADLYRSFAQNLDDAAGKTQLLQCAEREQANSDLSLKAAEHR